MKRFFKVPFPPPYLPVNLIPSFSLVIARKPASLLIDTSPSRSSERKLFESTLPLRLEMWSAIAVLAKRTENTPLWVAAGDRVVQYNPTKATGAVSAKGGRFVLSGRAFHREVLYAWSSSRQTSREEEGNRTELGSAVEVSIFAACVRCK